MSRQSGERFEEALSYRRRAVMGLLAAGVGLGVLSSGGVTAQEDDPADEDDPEDDEPEEVTDDVHPIFGYSAESLDVEPPVEPDHEVSLLESDREQADVPFPEWHFDPVGLYVDPGETVQFTLESHFHTITAYHPQMGYTQRVPDGVGSISSPVLWEDAYFLYTFDEPGVYDLLCLPHEWAGMVIRVVVGEATGPGSEEVPEPTWGDAWPDPDDPIAPDWLAATVLRDPAMDPDNVIDQGSVSWADLDPESKAFPIDLTPPDTGEPLVSSLSSAAHGVYSNGHGCAHFASVEGGLSYDLLLEDIEFVTQAHIHEGRRGETGPVVAPLAIFNDELDGTGDGEPRSAGPDTPIFESGFIDDTDLVEAILEDPSAFYVNVHTTRQPQGEIRGQIRRHEFLEEEPPDDDDDEEPPDDDDDEEPPDDDEEEEPDENEEEEPDENEEEEPDEDEEEEPDEDQE